MRIWDIDAGFLNSPSLLGEHRELHGIYSIITNDKKGYSKHPETLRWQMFPGSLVRRHDMLVAEMKLRGFNHHSPITKRSFREEWPPSFLDEPHRQYKILKEKYRNKSPGRIDLPDTIHKLWASHKYSVMARDYNIYKKMGSMVALNRMTLPQLSLETTSLLREAPTNKALQNTLLHMWGHISKFADKPPEDSPYLLLRDIQKLSFMHASSYLIQSTALGELACWIESQDC